MTLRKNEAKGTAQVSIHSSTIHTFIVELPEVAQTRDIGPTDEVRIVLSSRNGMTRTKVLTPTDLLRLFGNPDDRVGGPYN
jgi:hypothetical protein